MKYRETFEDFLAIEDKKYKKEKEKKNFDQVKLETYTMMV